MLNLSDSDIYQMCYRYLSKYKKKCRLHSFNISVNDCLHVQPSWDLDGRYLSHDKTTKLGTLDTGLRILQNYIFVSKHFDLNYVC